MEIKMMKVQDVHPYENNPRINDGAVDAVVESIKQYGFKVPVIIDGGGVLVTGHTRLKAAKKLGLKEIPAVIADDLTEEQCKAFRIADNKVSDFSIFDNKKLLEELEGLDDLFTGFETSDVFNSILDEKDKSLLDDLDDGFVYEASFKSPDEDKIMKITEMWEKLNGNEKE